MTNDALETSVGISTGPALDYFASIGVGFAEGLSMLEAAGGHSL